MSGGPMGHVFVCTFPGASPCLPPYSTSVLLEALPLGVGTTVAAITEKTQDIRDMCVCVSVL